MHHQNRFEKAIEKDNIIRTWFAREIWSCNDIVCM